MESEARFRVRLSPRARRTELAGWDGGVLKARVTAPPVDGRANEALRRLLAEALDVPPRDVAIVGGLTSREKTVIIRGVSDAEARRRLGAPFL